MSSLAQVATAMQHVLTEVADEAARQTGFVQRQSKLTGALFAQTTVLGWLAQPQASLAELAYDWLAGGRVDDVALLRPVYLRPPAITQPSA